jgi:hypothetical protein
LGRYDRLYLAGVSPSTPLYRRNGNGAANDRVRRLCRLCGSETEDEIHILFRCEAADMKPIHQWLTHEIVNQCADYLPLTPPTSESEWWELIQTWIAKNDAKLHGIVARACHRLSETLRETVHV